MNIQHLTCIKLYMKNIFVHAKINNKIFLTIRTFSWLNLCSSFSSVRILANLVIRLYGAGLAIWSLWPKTLVYSQLPPPPGWAAPRCTSTPGCPSHPRRTWWTSPAWHTNTFQLNPFSSCSLQSPGFSWQPSSYWCCQSCCWPWLHLPQPWLPDQFSCSRIFPSRSIPD